MTNIKEKDVDSEVGRDFTNFRIRTKLLSTCSGAGVNADSSVNLAFATADPLSELVWSPHSGLSLKCANRGADVRKPFLLWNVGLDSEGGHPPLRLERGGDDTVVDQSVSQTALRADHMIIGKSSSQNPRHTPELGPSHGDASESTRKFEEGDAIRNENCMVDIVQEIAEASPAVVASASLKKLESSAENECGELPKEKALPAEGSCMGSRISLYPEKGKGKALSDGDIYGRSSDDEDDSAQSSGHSSRGMKGVKRKIWDEGAILGSKRMKKQIHGSAFVIKPDSSFMKWISNMMTATKEDSLSPLPLACAKNCQENFVCFKPRGPAPATISMGFRSMFQSLYCRETGGKKIVESVEVSREVAVDDEKSPQNVDHLARDEASGEEAKIAAEAASLGRSSKPRTSLWITRLSTNTLRSEKGKEVAEETTDLDSRAFLEGKPVVSNMLPPSHRYSLEAMTSVFARRLDALRHMTPSKKGILTCLFCGGECPKSEVEDLKLKLSAFDCRVEESEHWAVSCPMAPRISGEGDCSSGKAPSYATWNMKMSSPLKPRKDAEDNQRLPLCDSATRLEMFDAIRNLRLTRADILRWMNSDLPLSHLNGFFLRLRLGNHQVGVGAGAGAGAGGSSYYVACITGEVTENKGCTSRKCISVDVGGIKSSVATQYVSNHDFLQDEIKAWWTRIIGSGCKIPSLADLNSKFNDRQTLGF